MLLETSTVTTSYYGGSKHIFLLSMVKTSMMIYSLLRRGIHLISSLLGANTYCRLQRYLIYQTTTHTPELMPLRVRFAKDNAAFYTHYSTYK